MTTPEQHGLVFSKEKLRIPRDRQGILDIMSSVLTKPYIQSVSMDTSGYMTVEWYKAPMDSLLTDVEEESVESVLNRIDLEELSYGSSLKEAMVDKYLRVMLKGYVPTFIISGDVARLKNILGVGELVILPVHTVTGRERYLGMQLIDSKEVPEDVLVLCGSHVEGATTSSIVYGVKMVF